MSNRDISMVAIENSAYYVTTDGKILHNGVEVKLYKRGFDGFYSTTLNIRGKVKTVLVHTLVAKAFLEQPNYSNYCVRHKDGDKSNNSVANLEYVPRTYKYLCKRIRVMNEGLGIDREFESYADFYKYIKSEFNYEHNYLSMLNKVYKAGAICGFIINSIS